MTQASKQKNPRYKTSKEEIISQKDGKPTLRIARFLQPSTRYNNQVGPVPKTPLLVDIFTKKYNYKKWPVSLYFSGWYKPIKGWNKWYERLVYKHASTWIEAGIVDGIFASLHKVPLNKELMYAVVEYWCPKTNTFMFPWGEATITLEDVMILGGLPVVGANTDEPMDKKCVKIVQRLERRYRNVSRVGKGGKVVKAFHKIWIEYFMRDEEEGEIENKEDESIEHAAFLCLWLCRYVFPDFDWNVVRKDVFPIAAKLSQGKPVALAPLVLGNLYYELTQMSNRSGVVPWGSKIFAAGLFQIVQLWVCERFYTHLAKPLDFGQPRIARWDSLTVDVTYHELRSRIKSGDGFLWRPYACDLQKWDHFPFYEETEQIVLKCSVLDDCMLSFARFLHPCVLLWKNCEEIYQPHRVARQFGYDQEVPVKFKALKYSWDEVGFYVPPRAYEPGVSKGYLNWWNKFIECREEAVMDALKRWKDDNDGSEYMDADWEGNGYQSDMMNDIISDDFSRPVLQGLSVEVEDRRVKLDLQPAEERQDKGHLAANSVKFNENINPASEKSNRTALVQQNLPAKKGKVSHNEDVASRVKSDVESKSAQVPSYRTKNAMSQGSE